MRKRVQTKSDVSYYVPRQDRVVNRLRDRYGNWVDIQFTTEPATLVVPGVTQQEMYDEVSQQLQKRLDALRAERDAELRRVRTRREVLINAFRSDLHRQLAEAVHSLQAYILATKGREPKWLTVKFASRKDYEDTRIPQWVLDGYVAAAKAAYRINRDTYWSLLFYDNLKAAGLVRLPGERYKKIPFRDNKFRRVVRTTKRMYQERLNMERMPDYSGPRYVTIDLGEVQKNLAEASFREMDIWQEIKSINDELVRQTNELALKRALFFANRRKEINMRKAIIRFVKHQAGLQFVQLRRTLDATVSMVKTYYADKMSSLRASFKVDDYHFLLRFSQPDREYPQVKIPGKVYGVRELIPTPVLGDPYRFRLGDTLSYSCAVVGTHLENEVSPPRGDLDFPLLPHDSSRSAIQSGIGEALARLYAGDPNPKGMNWLAGVVELRDLPSSYASLKSFFSWAKRSFSARTLRGATFRSVAEAYLEHIYGIAPTVEFGLLVSAAVEPLVEWIQTMVNLASLDFSTKTQSQSFKYTRSQMSEDTLNTEPIRFTAKLRHRLFSYQNIRYDGTSSPLLTFDTPYGIGSYDNEWWTVSPNPYGREFWATYTIYGIGGRAQELREKYPYNAYMYPWYYDEPSSYEDIVCDVDKDLYKVFTRPVPEDAKSSMGNEIRNLLWDNSLGQTLWNIIPFSFMIDWFTGIQDIMKGIDQLLVVGWQGSLRYLQPWIRHVREVQRHAINPTILLGTPTLSEKEVVRGKLFPEPGYDDTVAYSATISVPVTILRSFAAWTRFKAVRREELPNDGTFYLVEAFKRRVLRGVKINLPSSRRLFSVSGQVLALGTANDVDSAILRDFGVVRPSAKKPAASLQRAPGHLSKKTIPMMSMQEMRRVLESSGIVVR